MTGLNIFVMMTTLLLGMLNFFIALPSTISDLPLEYVSAVSCKGLESPSKYRPPARSALHYLLTHVLMPPSQAALMTFKLSSSSRTHGDPSHLLEPNDMHPRMTLDTLRPLLPSLTWTAISTRTAFRIGAASYLEYSIFEYVALKSLLLHRTKLSVRSTTSTV